MTLEQFERLVWVCDSQAIVDTCANDELSKKLKNPERTRSRDPAV